MQGEAQESIFLTSTQDDSDAGVLQTLLRFFFLAPSCPRYKCPFHTCARITILQRQFIMFLLYSTSLNIYSFNLNSSTFPTSPFPNSVKFLFIPNYPSLEHTQSSQRTLNTTPLSHPSLCQMLCCLFC